jgi:hypothetical protein
MQSRITEKRMKHPMISLPLPVLIDVAEVSGFGLYDFLTDARDDVDQMLGMVKDDEELRGQLAETLVVLEGLLAIIDDTNEDNDDKQAERFAEFLASRG